MIKKTLEGLLAETKPSGDCMEWQRGKNLQGYGQVWLKSAMVPAHRLVASFYFDDFKESDWVLHKCDNPPCINPDHLFLGDQSKNEQDKISKGRYKNGNSKKTHCKYGHELTLENVYVRPTGRECRACRARISRENHKGV